MCCHRRRQKRYKDGSHLWNCCAGDFAIYSFDTPQKVNRIRLVLDSNLNRPEKNIVALRTIDQPELKQPAQLLRNFDLSYQKTPGGKWYKIAVIRDNFRRLIIMDNLDITAVSVKLTVKKAWGRANFGVYSFDLA